MLVESEAFCELIVVLMQLQTAWLQPGVTFLPQSLLALHIEPNPDERIAKFCVIDES